MPCESEWQTRKRRIDARLKKSGLKRCTVFQRVEGLFARADQLEMRLARARASGPADALPSRRAFASQLEPQDPTDEPAEKLLARIGSVNARRPDRTDDSCRLPHTHP